MSKDLARAILKEIPLSQVEMYMQVLSSGVLQKRAKAAAQNGDWCGAGCTDGSGHVCGLRCLARLGTVGAFDVHGHSGVKREDLENAIKSPDAFRRTLQEELVQVSKGVETGDPYLGPRIDPDSFAGVVEGGPKR